MTESSVADQRKPAGVRRLWPDLVIVVAITAVAVALRYYRIGEVPPGFNSDEAVGAVGALETLRSGVRLHYAGQGGGGALGFYIAALAFALFGPGVATIRGTAAFAGVVSIIATYLLVREMFRDDAGGLRHARLLAALAALGMATSSWHVASSRVAFAAIGVPFLQAPAAFFLWRGLRTGRRIHFILSGVLLAAVAFIYMSGAFVPLVFAAFFLVQWAIARLSGRRTPAHLPLAGPSQAESPPFLRRPWLVVHFRNLLWCVGVAVLFLLPMVYFLLTTPEAATQRAQQTLFINPLINQGDPWGTLWRSLWGNLAAFGLSLDWLHGQAPANLIISIPMTLLFVVGLAVGTWRGLRGRPAYLFAALGWAIMLTPSILSPDSIPHAARALGAAVSTYTLIAIGMLAVAGLAQRLVGAAARAAPGPTARAAVTGVVLAGLWLGQVPQLLASYHHYFNVWPLTNDAQAAFHVYAVDLAAEMSKDSDPQTVYLLPRDTAAGDVNPNYTVMFLYTGQAGYAWVVDDERTLEETLNTAVAGRNVVRVVRWKASKHTGADPKEMIRYYLEKHGRYVETHTYAHYDIETYQLDRTGPDLRDAPLTPAEWDFGGVLTVTGYAYGDASGDGSPAAASAPAGGLMWARLRVRLDQPTPADLKVSVTIHDAGGHVAGQIDKLLLNNILHRPTSEWLLPLQALGGTAADTETDVYFLVPVAPAAAPGIYNVAVAVYGAADQQRLALRGQAPAAPAGITTRTALLGPLTVRPDLTPPRPAELGLTHVLERPVVDGLTLLGYAGPDSLRPGERAALALVWRASVPLVDDYRAQIWAAAEGTERALGAPQPLSGTDFPTHRWADGQVVRGWFDIRLPADMPNGTCTLGVRVADSRGQPVADIALGSLEVAGWPRRFDVPPMQFSRPANLGDRLELLGYDLQPPGVSGGGAEVVLYWRAAAAMDTGYTTFVHVLDAAGQMIAQVDHVPGDGAFPTTGWLPGEVIADRFIVPIPADRLGAAHSIEAGAYDPATLERLPQLDADGQIVDTRVLLPLAPEGGQADTP
jgi:hypothetical protein